MFLVLKFLYSPTQHIYLDLKIPNLLFLKVKVRLITTVLIDLTILMTNFNRWLSLYWNQYDIMSFTRFWIKIKVIYGICVGHSL